MEKEEKISKGQESVDENEETDLIELVLFQVSECYVYIIPPRKSAASYRADEWDVNKWAWDGALKVISKGEECIIRLEDKTTGGRVRHAFIGIGFRERTEAYDFQAALHDHMKYLNKKKTAEEMERHYQQTSSVDYSLKDGETLVLQLKNSTGSRSVKSKFCEQGLNDPSEEKGKGKESIVSIKPPPPPPPPAPLSPSTTVQKSPTKMLPHLNPPLPPPYKRK
ncbi:Adaptin ear-binding coat-associated protein 1 [Morella rubra]|uniref:Adaptin ear-binding coat-associated protein 1 n=1 Tax=Morella rubra TaxID=262757 RepID=A0A6A1VAQ4_9ROSI|nr:Adaptin ear-binding coat-associated protein 1 [Morella rubra]